MRQSKPVLLLAAWDKRGLAHSLINLGMSDRGKMRGQLESMGASCIWARRKMIVCTLCWTVVQFVTTILNFFRHVKIKLCWLFCSYIVKKAVLLCCDVIGRSDEEPALPDSIHIYIHREKVWPRLSNTKNGVSNCATFCPIGFWQLSLHPSTLGPADVQLRSSDSGFRRSAASFRKNLLQSSKTRCMVTSIHWSSFQKVSAKKCS